LPPPPRLSGSHHHRWLLEGPGGHTTFGHLVGGEAWPTKSGQSRRSADYEYPAAAADFAEFLQRCYANL
jgi:hypothetical protein